MLLSEFLNPIVLILLVAMVFSLFVKEWVDAFVILGIVMIDAVIGAIQEKRAQRIAKSLSTCPLFFIHNNIFIKEKDKRKLVIKQHIMQINLLSPIDIY